MGKNRKLIFILFAIMIAIPLIGYGVNSYWDSSYTEYNIPSDSIYLCIGPSEEPLESISSRDFRFMVYLETGHINITGNLNFWHVEKPHYLCVYVPFSILDVINRGDSDVLVDWHVDAVSGASSLVRVDIPANRRSGNYHVDIQIHVRELAAISKMGEKTVILTFGYPHVYKTSLKEHFKGPSVDLLKRSPIKVTIIADRGSYFSSETFPIPDVESLMGEHRSASLEIHSSGSFENFYRSVHCVTRNTTALTEKQKLLFWAPIFISAGVSLVISTVVGALWQMLSTLGAGTGRSKDSQSSRLGDWLSLITSGLVLLILFFLGLSLHLAG